MVAAVGWSLAKWGWHERRASAPPLLIIKTGCDQTCLPPPTHLQVSRWEAKLAAISETVECILQVRGSRRR